VASNTTYFYDKELTCKCGCGMTVQPDFLKKLNDLRELLKVPLVLTSAARCPIHNVKVGGAPSSKHKDGIAVDIAAKDGNMKYKIIEGALKLGFTGIGIHKDFIHLDTRKESQVVWLY
jgi:zinc D-Ala-D-Ala carboxypeptidase